MNKDVLQQHIALTSKHNLIMLIDIPFPVISTTQSLIRPKQIIPFGYSDISAHRSHHTLHFLLFVFLLHTQHATSMSNPTSIKTFTPDARSIFIPCYSYIGSYLKAVRAIAEIWNSILCFYSGS